LGEIHLAAEKSARKFIGKCRAEGLHIHTHQLEKMIKNSRHIDVHSIVRPRINVPHINNLGARLPVNTLGDAIEAE
jgi:hypothetical protein